MARQVVDSRKNHCPRQTRIANTPPQLAIDEITDTPGSQPQRHQRRNKVGNVEPGTLRLAGVKRHRHQHADKTAMERHAALPHLDNFNRIRQIVAGLVKQHLPQTAAENNPEHSIEQQIIELLHRPACFRKLRMGLDTILAKPPELQEGQQIHQAIPMNCQWAKRNGNRVELGMNQHRVLNKNWSYTL